MEIFRQKVTDRKERTISVRLLQEFGSPTPYFTPDKIQELWKQAKEFDVLFSDWTKGQLEPFLSTILSPSSTFFEFYDLELEEPLGIAYITQVFPGFDGVTHFTFWDKVARGREEICRELLREVFIKYKLHRATAKIPVYQRGVVGFAKKIGFVEEGRIREAVIYKENWNDILTFGLLRSELFQNTFKFREAGGDNHE